jgi:hypothetical protein
VSLAPAPVHAVSATAAATAAMIAMNLVVPIRLKLFPSVGSETTHRRFRHAAFSNRSGE